MLLANFGADISVLKRHGGWRSNSVAEAYIEDSLLNKINIFEQYITIYLYESSSVELDIVFGSAETGENAAESKRLNLEQTSFIIMLHTTNEYLLIRCIDKLSRKSKYDLASR